MLASKSILVLWNFTVNTNELSKEKEKQQKKKRKKMRKYTILKILRLHDDLSLKELQSDFYLP